MKKRLRELSGAPRIGIAIEGFGVPHVHIHMVPVFEGNDLDPHRASPAIAGELQAIAEELRRRLPLIGPHSAKKEPAGPAWQAC